MLRDESYKIFGKYYCFIICCPICLLWWDPHYFEVIKIYKWRSRVRFYFILMRNRNHDKDIVYKSTFHLCIVLQWLGRHLVKLDIKYKIESQRIKGIVQPEIGNDTPSISQM